MIKRFISKKHLRKHLICYELHNGSHCNATLCLTENATLSKREGLARRPDCNATLRTFRSKKGKVNLSLAFVVFCLHTLSEVFHENISLISFLFRNCFVSLQRYIIEITKQMAAVKPYLIEKLKQEHCLWSYDNDSIQDMPDDMLIELVMLYLDIDEINMLFSIFSYKKMKRAWIENVVAQGERYYNLNYFFAWYYFHAKRPRSYVKAMATRQLNKRLAA